MRSEVKELDIGLLGGISIFSSRITDLINIESGSALDGAYRNAQKWEKTTRNFAGYPLQYDSAPAQAYDMGVKSGLQKPPEITSNPGTQTAPPQMVQMAGLVEKLYSVHEVLENEYFAMLDRKETENIQHEESWALMNWLAVVKSLLEALEEKNTPADSSEIFTGACNYSDAIFLFSMMFKNGIDAFLSVSGGSLGIRADLEIAARDTYMNYVCEEILRWYNENAPEKHDQSTELFSLVGECTRNMIRSAIACGRMEKSGGVLMRVFKGEAIRSLYARYLKKSRKNAVNSATPLTAVSNSQKEIERVPTIQISSENAGASTSRELEPEDHEVNAFRDYYKKPR